ncbi:rhodanese-related sulfurtransferase [Streptomyces sp. 2333.5]|uniref:MBL fold metallo-hydrolase n=1 Tax=unclassified Streptomyces TaxID=2593676 RepID=UPI00089C3D6B|nr:MULTISPECIES: MBL fold metallo-hydrolase [unclassified Streptomyces]PJJ02526.1 rhodanese-related sulfurtransferase [Streptomyces sp. 2333.5]SED14174.1 Rhodanese-related sulfurtransferase [Streptomyces sp. 2314.4]SEE01614.1 Rhodanese-related sulfurtransferase [Streptomyces sp. 2112.2]
MHFAQYYLDCLSQASYLIGDETTGRAVLVDPRRDTDEYVRDAEAAGLRIELVVETHIHADFLSGHLELARATGATVCFGEAAETGFPIRRLRDGERIMLGGDDGDGVTLTVLATPGHTLESICLVIREHPDDEVPFGVLTGDTLFVGDVGRPDLLSAAGHSPEDMAARLHHSLHTKLLALPDATRVFPAHGAGSACGRSLSTETSSTIGDQRRLNYALQPMPEADFVRLVTAGQPATPGYFAHDAALNRDGHPLLEPGPPAALTLDEALAARDRQGAALLDCRPLTAYTRAHLAGSFHTSLDTRFAEYTGSVLAPGTPIVLLADPGAEQEARLRLARIGYDHVLGHLPDPAAVLERCPALIRRSRRIRYEELVGEQGWVSGGGSGGGAPGGGGSVEEKPAGEEVGAEEVSGSEASGEVLGGVEVADREPGGREAGGREACGGEPGRGEPVGRGAAGRGVGGAWSTAVQLIDVRNPAEYEAGALPGARNIPLAGLRHRIGELDPDRPVVLYCRSGNRSVIAAALLEAHGFGDVCDVLGGYEAVATDAA